MRKDQDYLISHATSLQNRIGCIVSNVTVCVVAMATILRCVNSGLVARMNIH